jgi:hypothetical protein
MPVAVRTWTQRHFTRPGIDLDRPADSAREDPNACWELSCLAPDPVTCTLRRGPAWTAAAALPAGIGDIAGAFLDTTNGRYCFIGEDGGDMKLIYTDHNFTAWQGPYTLLSGVTLGGLTGRNVSLWGGTLWVIGHNGNVYRNATYTGALGAAFYAADNIDILSPMNDRMFAASTTGDIKRLLSDGSAFGDYHTPAVDLLPLFLGPFRQYMTVVNRGHDDQVNVFRLPDYAAHGLHQLGHLPTPAHYADYGCPVANWDDKLWFVTGQQGLPASLHRLDLYTFNGHEISLAASMDRVDALDDPTIAGLLVWNNRLVFYDLDGTGYTGHAFKTLVGGTFVSYAPLASVGGGGAMVPFATALGDYLLVTDKTDTAQRIHYANREKLQDGTLITSRLDMGQAGRLKRLDRIAVVLDGAASGFKVVVKYRVDDTAAWTTATTGDNTNLVLATDLGVEFYLLQIRVDLDDDTGGHQDIGLEALSLTYTIDT